MTLEEELLREVDRTVKKLGTTRSALIRDSLRQYLKTIHTRQLEAKHRAGYAKQRVARAEFDVPESDRHWGE
jgi:metal-responsive CopG/Arc/MetJ family transcriptional regulator